MEDAVFHLRDRNAQLLQLHKQRLGLLASMGREFARPLEHLSRRLEQLARLASRGPGREFGLGLSLPVAGGEFFVKPPVSKPDAGTVISAYRG